MHRVDLVLDGRRVVGGKGEGLPVRVGGWVGEFLLLSLSLSLSSLPLLQECERGGWVSGSVGEWVGGWVGGLTKSRSCLLCRLVGGWVYYLWEPRVRTETMPGTMRFCPSLGREEEEEEEEEEKEDQAVCMRGSQRPRARVRSAWRRRRREERRVGPRAALAVWRRERSFSSPPPPPPPPTPPPPPPPP